MKFESTQTIGIELEMYVNNRIKFRNTRGTTTTQDLIGYNGLTKWLTHKEIRGFHVVPDGSLGNSGAEMKFDQGVPLCDANERIENMNKIATDPQLKAHFGFAKKGCLIPKDVRNELRTYNVEQQNSTGLHIHFGVPKTFNCLDVLRLLMYMDKNHKSVCKLAWRKSDKWARRPQRIIKSFLNRCLDKEFGAGSLSGSIYQLRPYFGWSKYEAVNLGNLTCKYHTIEFRYADASLMTDLDAFYKYLAFLKDAFDKCFTGETELIVKGKKLVITDDKHLEVYRQGWYLSGLVNKVNVSDYVV